MLYTITCTLWKNEKFSDLSPNFFREINYLFSKNVTFTKCLSKKETLKKCRRISRFYILWHCIAEITVSHSLVRLEFSFFHTLVCAALWNFKLNSSLYYNLIWRKKLRGKIFTVFDWISQWMIVVNLCTYMNDALAVS